MPEVQELRRYIGDQQVGKTMMDNQSHEVMRLAKLDGRNHRQRYRADRLTDYQNRFNARTRWLLG